ncbi:putative U3 small nucleolar ribonucleoprotein complex, subunit Mpp10 [Helianthus anomalus]
MLLSISNQASTHLRSQFVPLFMSIRVLAFHNRLRIQQSDHKSSTSYSRCKNSALGEDLDWERNVKPPPVITEEVSQSIEELIMKRISEGHFDDVQKVNKLPSKAPREMKELVKHHKLLYPTVF